jgi:putative Mg2+ transporter-C (MgtC) family protein
VTATVTLQDVALRLLAAVLAGAVIGFDRGTHGRVAGLRTTILMCVAAAGAMIEANLMLGVVGKTDTSFTMMDALRFPLGVLSGVGFIGAGAILRRGDRVTGVTTAATLWLITIVGLVLGAGYFIEGAIIVAIAFVVLSMLVRLEPLMNRQHQAEIVMQVTLEGPSAEELRAAVAEHYGISLFAVSLSQERLVRCRVHWKSREGPVAAPPLVDQLAAKRGVLRVDWQPVEAGQHED